MNGRIQSRLESGLSGFCQLPPQVEFILFSGNSGLFYRSNLHGNTNSRRHFIVAFDLIFLVANLDRNRIAHCVRCFVQRITDIFNAGELCALHAHFQGVIVLEQLVVIIVVPASDVRVFLYLIRERDKITLGVFLAVHGVVNLAFIATLLALKFLYPVLDADFVQQIGVRRGSGLHFAGRELHCLESVVHFNIDNARA